MQTWTGELKNMIIGRDWIETIYQRADPTYYRLRLGHVTAVADSTSVATYEVIGHPLVNSIKSSC